MRCLLSAILILGFTIHFTSVNAHADSAQSDRFNAVHLTRDGITRVTATVGDFTLAGPELATLRPADKRLTGVTYVPAEGRYYGMTAHYVGPLDATGQLIKIEPPESIERLSWVGGIAYDEKGNRLLITTKGGDGYLYEYKLDTKTWRIIANLQGIDLESIALHQQSGMLHAVARLHGKPGRQLVTLNTHGAVVVQHPLDGPSFYERLSPIVQLGTGDNGLYLLVSHDKHPRVTDELWRIDPLSGATIRMPYNADRDLTSGTWPGWPGGPKQSLDVKVPIATPFGSKQYAQASSYEVPTKLTEDQGRELHVVTMHHGGLQLGEYLKKISKLNISVSDKTGVAVQLELNPDHTVQLPVVVVNVTQTTKPVVLVLGSQQKIVWDIQAEPGVVVDTVYLFGQTDSAVAGVAPSQIKPGNRDLAVAWELERGGNNFDQFIAAVRKETGLYEASFQGSPQALEFTVPISNN